ncbi:MAG: DUF2975 domain-containing protein [Clostridia bacterium]|nr:DUF2975 domain-containing protein [Clostridia bacterium]
MFRLSNKASTVISIVLIFLLLGALGFLVYWLPDVTESLINAADNLGNRISITEAGRRWVLIDAYLMVAVAVVAVILMFFVLRAVLMERIFTASATRLIGAVSLCCFAEGVLFAAIGVWFQLAFAAAVAACFVGLCLRVVKNVIEEATRIKSENDFTI